VACSDLCIPAERLFDLSLGDLYVLQTPASLVTEGEVAAINFAEQYYGIDLVLVLGHSACHTICDCNDVVTRTTGRVASEVQRTLCALGRLAASGPAELDRLSQNHTLRMASYLRKHLSPNSTAAVLAAHFDEQSGYVHLLSPQN
jgi:carbonic anhydrase